MKDSFLCTFTKTVVSWWAFPRSLTRRQAPKQQIQMPWQLQAASASASAPNALAGSWPEGWLQGYRKEHLPCRKATCAEGSAPAEPQIWERWVLCPGGKEMWKCTSSFMLTSLWQNMWKMNPRRIFFFFLLRALYSSDKQFYFKRVRRYFKIYKQNMLSGMLLFYAVETVTQKSIIFLYFYPHLLLACTCSS